MARAIVYCDMCGKIIPPAGPDRIHAIVGDTSGVCQECAGKLTPEQCEVLRQRLGGEAAPPPPAGRPAVPPGPRTPTRQSRRISAGGAGAAPVERAARASARQARPSRRLEAPVEEAEDVGEPGSRRGLVIVGLAAGLLVGVAVALLLGSGPSEEPDPGDKNGPTAGKNGGKPKPPPAKTDTPPKPPTAAQKRFAQIKYIFDPSFRNYEEGRRVLREFLAKHPDGPEAEEAKTLLAKMGGDLAKAAEADFAQTARRAEQLAGWHRADEAKRILESFRKRSTDGEWYKAGGEAKIESALAKVEEVRVTAAKAALDRARTDVAAGRYKQARRMLGPRGRWPRDVRDAAEAVLREIVALEAKAEKMRGRDAKWSAFLVALHLAGKKGVREAHEVAARDGAAMRELGFGEKLARLEVNIREAKLVDELAVLGLRASKALLRLAWKDRNVAGRVAGVEGGVLKLKPSVGDVIEIPLGDLPPKELLRLSGLAKPDKDNRFRIAAYLALRGEFEEARERLVDVEDKKAKALSADIDEFARVIVPPKITSAAPPEAGKGAYYSHTFAASGTEPVSFALDDAARLPAGLKWNAATGTISGTPGAAGASAEVTLTASNGIAPDAKLAFTITVIEKRIAATGKILREWWLNSRRNSSEFLTGRNPPKPSGQEFITRFDGPQDWKTSYNSRIRGYIHPPVDGDYVFRFIADDEGQLWLSTDDDPANLRKMVASPRDIGYDDWSKVSAKVPLKAGQRYYIEAVHK
ncbi:MAG: putative Ig domain-containing protein, partial [Planctomycetota bacterium]